MSRITSLLACALLAACADRGPVEPSMPATGRAIHNIVFSGVSTTGFPIEPVGSFVEAYGISPTGDVVGGDGHFAFVWSNGVRTNLPLPPLGAAMQARGINSRGQIVGIVQGLPRGNGAFLYENGVSSLLLGPPGSSDNLTEAYAINEQGTAGGRSFVIGRGQIPVLWHNGVPMDLGGAGLVYDVNEHDVAVGFSQSEPDFRGRATVWRDGQRIILPDFPGATESLALGINDDGVVVGSITDASGRINPVMWTADGQLVPLPDFGGRFNFAQGINNSGVIVGRIEVQGQGSRAVVWRNGQLTDLGTIPGGFLGASGWAINDNGEIAGWGGTGSVVWSLTPPRSNEVPVAAAGADQSVNLDGARVASVQLDGSASTDDGPSDGLTYSWREGTTSLASGAHATISLGIGAHTITLVVSDGELESSDEVIVTVTDPTAPKIVEHVDGTLGDHDWYRSAVTISFDVSDAESDITGSTCATVVVAEDTAERTLLCSATSAGGTATWTRTIKRDATKPAIVFNGRLEYGIEESVEIDCVASDALSGIAVDGCMDESRAAFELGAGPHTLTATARDNAGNETATSVTFVVRVTETGLCSLVERWVGQRGIANSLCQKLRNGSIDAFLNEVRAQSGKAISADRATSLSDLAAALR